MRPRSTSRGRLHDIKAATKDYDLLEKLKAERLKVSSELDCAPYIIASDKALITVTIRKPCTLERLINCKGATDMKIFVVILTIILNYF